MEKCIIMKICNILVFVASSARSLKILVWRQYHAQIWKLRYAPVWSLDYSEGKLNKYFFYFIQVYEEFNLNSILKGNSLQTTMMKHVFSFMLLTFFCLLQINKTRPCHREQKKTDFRGWNSNCNTDASKWRNFLVAVR